jgi:hypothetical protein
MLQLLIMITLIETEQQGAVLEEANRGEAVVELAAEVCQMEGRHTTVNLPGDQHHAVRVGNRDYFPQVVAFDGWYDPTGRRIDTVCVVATMEEVSAAAAAEWKALTESGFTFHLFVPRTKRAAALRLCSKFGIETEVWCWYMEAGSACFE